MSSSESALAEAIGQLIESAAARWASFVIRGIITLSFGIIFLVYPTSTLDTFTRLFGAFFIIDGVFCLLAVALLCRSGATCSLWSPYAFASFISLVIGGGTVAYPEMTTASYFIILGVWFLLIGLSELSIACILRKGLSNASTGFMVFGGVLYVIFAIVLLSKPSAVASTLTRIAGIIVILFGLEVIFVGVELRSIHKSSSGNANLSSNAQESSVI